MRISINMKSVNIRIKLRLSNNLAGACTLLPSLSDNNIKLLNSFHISQNQPIDLPYVFALAIQNGNMNRTVQLRKKQELGFFTLLNEETENKIKNKIQQ